MTRSDAVSPELALAVLRRDEGCMAPRLGGSAMDCWGGNGIEHVKAEPRMGKRAEPRLDRLITLCDGHREPGARAGYCWATAKENREACRGYLRALYPKGPDGECPQCGGDCAPECGLHPAGCVYGGFSEYTGYWLIADGCDRHHGEEPA